MSNRVVQVPEPFINHQRLVAPGGGVVEHDEPYGFREFVVEFAWPYPKWDAEEAWQDAQIRIGAALAAEPLPEELVLEEMDWEKLREAVKAATIRGPHAPRLRVMQRAVRLAESVAARA